jgi:hypothetical protein
MRRGIGFVFTTLILVALVLDPVRFNSASVIWPWWLIQLLLILVVLALFRRSLRIYHKQDEESSKPRKIHEIELVPEDEAYALQRLAGRFQMDAKQARILALAILQPAELRERVAERYEPRNRTLQQEVAIEAKISGRLYDLGRAAETGRPCMDVYFPVLVIPKGSFNDNLTVLGADENRIPVLSYREYLQLAARLMRLFFYLAYDVKTDDQWRKVIEDASKLPLDHNVHHLEHRALCEIMRRTEANIDVRRLRGVSPVSQEADRLARHIEELPVPTERTVYLRLAAALLRKMSQHYALVAATTSDEDGRIFIKYQRTLIPELNLINDELEAAAGKIALVFGGLYGALKRGRAWLRILFGARPVSVTVSLDNAWTCQSYHVRVDAPEGLYLASQRLIASKKYLGLTTPQYKAKGAPTGAHYRFRRRLGQSYAHFYGRFFPSPLAKERRPKLRLEFYEVPPGSIFRAAIASMACLALVWVVGFIISRTSDPGTDVPAWLLVFPGVAASWLGFDAPAGRFFEGTLTARLSLALTTIISVAASGLFVLNTSGLTIFNGSMPTETTLLSPKIRAAISVFGVTKWAWAILIVLSLFNTTYMIYRWLRYSARFKYFAERLDPGRESQN